MVLSGPLGYHPSIVLVLNSCPLFATNDYLNILWTRSQTITFIRLFSHSKSKWILNEDVFLFIKKPVLFGSSSVPVTWLGPEETDAKRMCLFRASVLTVWGKTVTPTNNDKTVTAALCQLTYSKGKCLFFWKARECHGSSRRRSQERLEHVSLMVVNDPLGTQYSTRGHNLAVCFQTASQAWVFSLKIYI